MTVSIVWCKTRIEQERDEFPKFVTDSTLIDTGY